MTSRWTETGYNVQNTGWESGFDGESGRIQCAQWCLFGWFQYADAASGNCWSPFPGQLSTTKLFFIRRKERKEKPRGIYHEQRIVPWDDLTNNSNWFFTSQCQCCPVRWNGVSMNLIAPAGIVPECINGTVDVEHRVTVCFAIVQ